MRILKRTLGHLKEFTGRCCGKRRTKSRNSSRSTASHRLPIIRQVATSPQTALPSVRQPKKTVVNNASRCLNRFSPSARRARPPHHAAHRAACQTALVRIETTVAPSNLLPSRVTQAARSIENCTHPARFLTLAGSSNRAHTKRLCAGGQCSDRRHSRHTENDANDKAVKFGAAMDTPADRPYMTFIK